MKTQQTFFDFAAEVGLTKHIGGVGATDALVELCHIGRGKNVLDVGCGVGITPSFIARKYGCSVVGVDILFAMVKRSMERAKRDGIVGKTKFRVADAQNLPFLDNHFDAVITESVTTFPEDKQKAVDEYVRVTKPGGYIGLNEATWIKSPPPEVVSWASQELGGSPKPLTAHEWVALLETAGLKEIIVKTDKINLKDETKGIMQRYGCGGMMRVWWKILCLYVKNPTYREFVKEIQKGGLTPTNLDEYFGYGLYIGRKLNGSEH